MEKQNYKNHVRLYPPTHFFVYPVSLLLTIGAAWMTYRAEKDQLIWAAITLIFFLLMVIAVLGRQHYALNNQNRIVRLEMRLRYYQLTGKRLEPLEEQLTFGRIAALRFSPDEELPTLLERALKENLTADEIKKAVKNWLEDDMRA